MSIPTLLINWVDDENKYDRKKYKLMLYFHRAKSIQRFYRGFRQRKKYNKYIKKLSNIRIKIENNCTHPLVELNIYNSKHKYSLLEIPTFLVCNFKYIVSRLKYDLKLSNIRIENNGKFDYVVVSLWENIPNFDTWSFYIFFNYLANINKTYPLDEYNDNTWGTPSELDVNYFFIKNIQIGCDYFNTCGVIIEKRIDFFLNQYFKNISIEICNKVIFRLVDLYKYKSLFNNEELLLLKNVKDYENNKITYIIKDVLLATITSELITLYKKNNEILDTPCLAIYEYIEIENNNIKLLFEEVFRNRIN